MLLSSKLAPLHAESYILLRVPTEGCPCRQDPGVITAVVGSATYAATRLLGRCIPFVEKLNNRTWNGCKESVPLTPYAAAIVISLFYDILG